MAKWKRGFPDEAKKANAASAASRGKKADAHALSVGPRIAEFRLLRYGWGAIAELLELEHETPRGGYQWHKMTVKRVYERYQRLRQGQDDR